MIDAPNFPWFYQKGLFFVLCMRGCDMFLIKGNGKKKKMDGTFPPA